ncbi:MAG: hypothetical protein MUF80_07695 [Burkholderiales bacterium]|nr:hypothetical protein [Burkholderiales bacterium]
MGVTKHSTRRHIPVYVIEVPPYHLCRLAGRAVHFLRYPDDPSTPAASIEIVDDGMRLVPTAFESHTRSGPFGQVATTRSAGVCMACLDRHGRYVALITVQEIG